MPRVLVIEAAGNLWGSERALLDLLDGLGRLGPTKVAVCMPPSMPLEAELRNRDIPVYPYFIYALHQRSKWRRVQAAVGVLRACLAFRPGTIYLNQAGAYRVVRPAAFLCRLGIVAHVRIFEDAIYLAGCAPNPSRLRGIVAISRAIEREVRSHPTLSSITTHTLYDAYAPTTVGPQAAVPAPGVKRIACVGRVVPIKGQDILVRALATVLKSHPDVECLMIGDGEPDYLRKAEEAAAPLAGAVKWLGFQRDVRTLLETCAVLVCPSWREPLGRVILEAWDAGLVPIAFSGSGGAAELLANANGGLLYDEQEPVALAKAILTALSLSPPERLRVTSNGRAWLAANCDPTSYAGAIANILSRSTH